MPTVNQSNDSKTRKLLHATFVISFIILVLLLTQRLIAYPSQDIEDVTIFFYLVIIVLILVFYVALILLYGEKKQRLIKIKHIVYVALLTSVSGLSWSLRGVWGHETGALVWGTLLFSVLMLENKRDHWILLIFFAILGLSIGANLPFATYPFIPRLLHFASWGMLGCFFAAFGRYVFHAKKFKSQEDFKTFHVQFSIAGFLGMAFGITLASALYINEGWTPAWIGGYVTGIFYGLITCIYLHYNNKQFHEETDSPEFLGLYANIVEPKSTRSKISKFVFYLMIMGVVPVIGTINAAIYNYVELGYTEISFLIMISLCGVYVIIAILLISKFFTRLGKINNKNLELAIIFLPTLWLSSISAMLRRDTGQAPDLIHVILSFEFERSVLYICIISSLLFVMYLLLTHVIENKE